MRQAPVDAEADLRRRLGVPTDAARVMVVTESTHWDPNWLLTSGEYFRLCVRRTLDQALDALVDEPRRVFSLECMFFPGMYWRDRPSRQDQFRSLVNEGRLRFTGSGVTTPDTLLPDDELVLRDLLIGQEWLRSRGMTQEPRVLYLPDSFGHSPGVPALLTAAGVPYAAVCRIDGMRFPGADMESAARFPRPGTTAEQLLAKRTADFVWRGPDGSEVLAHWHTFGYGHGDMIASGGLSRALGLPAAWSDRRERHVAARIDRYIDQLSNVARTPYLLLAVGFDFVRPVRSLVDLLDRWNQTGYERTGVWLVNAGLDDYLGLVAFHRDELPTVSLDPNPYWMGFYASRPELKVACRDLGRRLVAADNERAMSSIASIVTTRDVKGVNDDGHRSAWWTAATSNHHDYITGTAPDRVALGEQMRWLNAALAGMARTDTLGDVPDRSTRSGPADRDRLPCPSWSRDGTRVTVATGSLTAVFDEQWGGALVSLTDVFGIEQLRAPSLELRSYTESGGLWRMGHEFRGGRWALGDRTTLHHGEIRVTRCDDALRLTIQGRLDDRPSEIGIVVTSDRSELLVHTSVTAPKRRTVTLASHQRTPVASLAMHQPGGMVTRPLRRWYEPTFWPLHSFAAALPDTDAGTGEAATALVIAAAAPTALHATASGTVEVVVARTATKELAFGAIPVLAPAWGRKWGTQHADLALRWVDRPDPATAISVGRDVARRVDRAAGRSAPIWLIDVDNPLVEVTTVKLADRGDGIVVRLRSWAPPGLTQMLTLRVARSASAEITSAWLADSRERDLAALGVSDGAVRLEIEHHLTTVRISLRPLGDR